MDGLTARPQAPLFRQGAAGCPDWVSMIYISLEPSPLIEPFSSRTMSTSSPRSGISEDRAKARDPDAALASRNRSNDPMPDGSVAPVPAGRPAPPSTRGPAGAAAAFDKVDLPHLIATVLDLSGGNVDWRQTELTEQIVRALTSAVDAKDPYTRGHSDRVARIAARLAEELGCDAEMQKVLHLAGLLHDIGKIGVDDKILRKAEPLSEAEYEHIKQHTEIGHRILHDLLELEDVLQVVLHHHEWWDGSGYPQQLGRGRIPLGARIVAVADAFDAMSSDRPYRKRMSDVEVDQILRAGAGRQWDPDVVGAFFRCRDAIRAETGENDE